MLRIILSIIMFTFSGVSMSSELESRQAFLLIDAEPDYDLRIESKNPEVPSFSVETEDDFIMIPIAPGAYKVGNISFDVVGHKINLIRLKWSEGKWIKSEALLGEAKDFLNENYPILKLDLEVK